MKIEDIEAKKTYWKVYKKPYRRGQPSVSEAVKVFVLEVDQKNKTVLASVGGAPAQPFSKAMFGRWKKDNPCDTPNEC
jgi:hypothetical protein